MAWRRRIVGSGKSKWVKTKTIIALNPRRTTFASTSTKTNPWSLWLFGWLGYLSQIGLLGWTDFEITDAMAPTPEQSFSDFREILSKGVKDRMGRWEVCRGTFLYVGIRRVSKIKTLNPVYARIKSISPNPLAKQCIKEPFTIAPMKRQRSDALQLVTLKVWS